MVARLPGRNSKRSLPYPRSVSLPSQSELASGSAPGGCWPCAAAAAASAGTPEVRLAGSAPSGSLLGVARLIGSTVPVDGITAGPLLEPPAGDGPVPSEGVGMGVGIIAGPP